VAGVWVAAAVPFETLESQRYKVGEGDAVPGLELALRHSRRGERLRVRFSSRFGYGPDGRPAMRTLEDRDGNSGNGGSGSVPAVPADVGLEYEICVLAHVPEGALDVALLRAACGGDRNSSSGSSGLQAVARELALTEAEAQDAEARGERLGTAEPETETETETETEAEAEVTGAEGVEGVCIEGVEGESTERQRRVERLGALSELLQRKEAGNRWFSHGSFSRAARAYSKGTQVADRYFNGAPQGGPGGEAGAGAGGGGGGAGAGGAQQAAVRGMLDAQQRGADPEEARAAAEQQIAAAEVEQLRRSKEPIGGAEAEVLGAYVQCLNNMAACQLRLGEAAKAKEVCVQVLEIDPDNQKALLRAAKAALAMHVSLSISHCSHCTHRLLDICFSLSLCLNMYHCVSVSLSVSLASPPPPPPSPPPPLPLPLSVLRRVRRVSAEAPRCGPSR
jgi:hypothetical protein